MENRFGIKDFVVCGLIILLIGVVLLAMVQFDRQREQLNALAEAQRQQVADLGQIQASLKSMRFSGVAPATTQPVADAADPFGRMRVAQASANYAAGDTLTWSGPSINKLTPLMSTDAFAGKVQDIVFQSLLARDPDSLDWKAQLAEPGWTVADHTAEYLAYRKAHPTTAPVDAEHPAPADPNCPAAIVVTYTVRPNATFSDGTPVTADDVVWTYEWIMNPKVDAVRARVGMDKVRGVKRVGNNGVAFELAEPYFDYLGLTGTMQVLPRHHYESYKPSDYNAVACDLLGSGPFQLESPNKWQPGKEVVLIRNEKFWGPRPALASIRFRIIVTDQVRLTAFKNGELDRLETNPVQYNSLLKNADLLARTQHYSYDTVNTGYRFVAWNQHRPGEGSQFFADRRVRRAMTMLLDRQRICDDILLGLATVPTGPFNRLGKQNDPAIQPLAYDVAAARALLAEAGWTDDGSGSLRNKAGEPLRFKLTYPSGSPLVDRIVLFMKDTMSQGGVTLDPDPQDWSIFSDRMKQHQFDAIMLGWTAGLEGDIYQMFDSHEIDNGGEDFMSYRNPELDDLIERARQTVDEAARIPMWRRCHEILHEDQPYTFMSVSKNLLFLDKRFHNVQLLKTGVNDVAEWYVPAPDQKYKN